MLLEMNSASNLTTATPTFLGLMVRMLRGGSSHKSWYVLARGYRPTR